VLLRWWGSWRWVGELQRIEVLVAESGYLISKDQNEVEHDEMCIGRSIP
jgi:hypothetical protein